MLVIYVSSLKAIKYIKYALALKKANSWWCTKAIFLAIYSLRMAFPQNDFNWTHFTNNHLCGNLGFRELM